MFKASDSYLKANVPMYWTPPLLLTLGLISMVFTLLMGNLGSVWPSWTHLGVTFVLSQGKMDGCKPKKGLPVNFRSVYNPAWPGKPTDVATVPLRIILWGAKQNALLPLESGSMFLAFSLNLSFQGVKSSKRGLHSAMCQERGCKHENWHYS